jgi:hypothetical protein
LQTGKNIHSSDSNFFLGVHSLKQVLNTTYVKTQYRKNFAAYFIILPASSTYSSMVGQLVNDSIQGFEKKQSGLNLKNVWHF